MEISNTTFQYLILAIVALAAINLATILVVFATGVGKRVVQRIKQRWRYKHGKHVNVIFLYNNHVSKELFVEKEEDGSFKVNDKRYCINPLATFIHDGIPTQINHEGIVEPYNIFDQKDVEKMSTAEIEAIIMNNESEGLAALMRKIAFWTIAICLLTLLAAGAAAYFGFQLHDYIIKKEILKASIVAAQTAADLAAQNLTGVVPR